MKKLLTVSAVILSVIAAAQTNNLQYFVNQSREAQKAGDHKKFYEMIMAAHKLHPLHQGILYQCGVAAALNNKNDEALDYLKRAIVIKADYDLAIPELKSLEGNDGFTRLKTLQEELLKPIVTSDTAFVIKDRSLHVESIAAGEANNIFYVGSIHKRKIVRVNEKGDAEDFTATAQDGLCSVFGLKIDKRKKVLWACSSPLEEMENYDTTTRAAVYKYDLTTRKLLAIYYPSELKGHIFGDLTLDPDGNVFVSDSKNNTVFKVNEQKKTLEKFLTSDEFRSLQGLAFNDNGSYLFVADYGIGIYRVDMKTRAIKFIAAPAEVSTKAIDGLTFYRNSLIGIQNLVFPMRATRYYLDATADAIKQYEIIDRGHPAFNEPTIGCLVNNTFYYVANSLWSGYDQQHKLKSPDQLQDVVILKVDLK